MIYLPGMGDPNFEVRTIMHDNLSSHLNVRVAATINQAGHRVIARLPTARGCPLRVCLQHSEAGARSPGEQHS